MTVLVVNRVDVGSARAQTRADRPDPSHAERKIARRLALAWVALTRDARGGVPARDASHLLSRQR
jgi:hypothetical protein